MNLTTEVLPTSIVLGMKVWFSYTSSNTVSPFSEGIVVCRKGNKIVVFTPRHYVENSEHRNPFNIYNRHTFTWRASRLLWQEAGDNSPNPMTASLWFPCQKLQDSTSPVTFLGKNQDGAWDIGTATPEECIKRWNAEDPDWLEKAFRR